MHDDINVREDRLTAMKPIEDNKVDEKDVQIE